MPAVWGGPDFSHSQVCGSKLPTAAGKVPHVEVASVTLGSKGMTRIHLHKRSGLGLSESPTTVLPKTCPRGTRRPQQERLEVLPGAHT